MINISTKQVMKVTDNSTNEDYFLLMNDKNEWVKITQKDYNNIIRGKKDEQ